jgi:hypothetical protein
MLSDSEILAVRASECQLGCGGHKPVFFGGQGLLAEKLALKYDACQFHSS